MKVVNDLHRPTIITAQEVQKVVSKTTNLDLNRVRSNIIVAEERFLRNILGFDFYEALLEEKNVEVTSENKDALQTQIRDEWNDQSFVLNVGDVVNSSDTLSDVNKKLWKYHLWQIAAECVMFVAYPDNYTDFTSQGVIHNTPRYDSIGNSGANTPELNTIRFQMDKILTGRINPLLESMHQFICKSKSSYPKYDKTCDCDVTGKSYAGSGPTFINIYEDDEEDDCDCPFIDPNAQPLYAADGSPLYTG